MKLRLPQLLAAALLAGLAALACRLPSRTALEQTPAGGGPSGGTRLPASAVPGEATTVPELPGGILIPGVLGGGEQSPPYEIYVGANVTGRCGPETNSGGFSSLTFDTAFHGIHFAPPSETGLPGPFGGIFQEGELAIGIPGVGLLGEGTLGAFSLCPMYEGDIAHPCIVTEGPYPFEPNLSVGPVDPDALPVVPLAGTPSATGGPQMLLVFSIGASADMGPILEWNGEVGSGALGGSLEPVQAPFPVSWEQLARGEEFSLEVITGDDGETWEWTMRFVPSR